MTITVKNRQNIFDIALVNVGAAEAAYAIAYDNGLGVSDIFGAGQELIVEDSLIQAQGPGSKRVVAFYKIHGDMATCDLPVNRVFDGTFDSTFN